MNLNQELDLRAQILVDLEMMSQGWTQPLSRQQLLDYSINGIRLPLIDYTRGIRNPRDFAATLAVVSSSNGPYPDREVFAGMWEYRFADGSAVSDNKKLIAASELQVPLILSLSKASTRRLLPHPGLRESGRFGSQACPAVPSRGPQYQPSDRVRG